MTRMLTALLAVKLALEARRPGREASRDERGSVTTEHVLWTVAVIAIVGIVVAAVKTYVTSQAGNIK
jgi:heme/copper-type cytochrome/quinol oxidase subunit 2